MLVVGAAPAHCRGAIGHCEVVAQVVPRCVWEGLFCCAGPHRCSFPGIEGQLRVRRGCARRGHNRRVLLACWRWLCLPFPRPPGRCGIYSICGGHQVKWMVTVIGKSPNSEQPFAVNMYQGHIHRVMF